MKKLVALTLLVSGTTALADSSRSIYDLMYLPKAGTVYGISEARYQPWKQEIKSGGAKIDYNESGVQQTAGYSVSDMLALSARVGYTYTKFDGPTHKKFDGITDPVLNGRFRVMDGDYRLDILGEGLISLGDQKIKSNGNGNVLTGGHQVAAGAHFGQKHADWQWSVKGLGRRYFKATTDDKSSGTKTKDKEHFGVDLTADILGRLNNESNLRAYYSAIMEERFKDNAGDYSAQKNTYTFGVEYQYVANENLMVRGGIGYSWIKQGQIKEWNTFVPNIAANYQF